MKYSWHIPLILLLMTAVSSEDAMAQRQNRRTRRTVTVNTQSSQMVDSINAIGLQYAARIDSLATSIHPSQPDQTTFSPAVSLSNPYYYPLFASNTLLRLPVSYTIGNWGKSPYPTLSESYSGTLVPPAFSDMLRTVALSYIQHPQCIRYTLAQPAEQVTMQPIEVSTPLESIPNNSETLREAEEKADAPIELPTDDHPVFEDHDLGGFYIHIHRPNFWTFKGNFALQFMQYYVSDNWYKGGDSHFSMLGMMNLEANYNNKQRLTFDNKLEMKLGFQTTSGDPQRKLQTNADLIRLTNKLGIRAHKHWYYTAMLQSWSQFYKAYEPGTDKIRSRFLSPFESVLSLGMDYELEKKRIKLSVNLAPLAANLKYCREDAIVTLHGIEEGKNMKIDYGATMTATMRVKLMQQINWESRVYAFYDYSDHAKVEWENTINLQINKYFSTKLFLYPRYDNNVPKSENDSYFQFNEYLSVGLDLKF